MKSNSCEDGGSSSTFPLLKKSHLPHPSIEISALRPDSLIHLRQINNAVLPSRYSDKWYNDALEVGALAQLAFFDNKCVGAVRCAVDQPHFHAAGTQMSDSSPERKIYIMTLAVLSPYREYGIATLLIERILAEGQELGIHEVYVHAWTENTEAIEWYEKRGFTKSDQPLKGYYRKMIPKGDAYILCLKF